jgi:hypothetical protein
MNGHFTNACRRATSQYKNLIAKEKTVSVTHIFGFLGGLRVEANSLERPLALFVFHLGAK